jgi:hypothetical protein
MQATFLDWQREACYHRVEGQLRNHMQEPSGSSLGHTLGTLAVVVGILFLGVGAVYTLKGQSLEGIDGLLFGGLALVAGCVILHRRGKAKSGSGES